MYLARLICALGLSSILFLNISCSEEPIQTDLSNINQSLDTLSLNNISGFTYQISPEIGLYQSLYVGEKNSFLFPFSLFKFSSNGWETFKDSSVVIDSIFFKLYSGDSLINVDIGLTLNFSTDSIFSEVESYMNQLKDIDLSQWTNLGIPNVSIATDTSDTISHFQESILSWDLSVLLDSLTDTTDVDLHRTFSISFSENVDSSFIDIYSREYSSGSMDPKIEVYYRSIMNSSDGDSLVDTLTRIIYVAEDLSVIDNPDSYHLSNNTIMISRGRGYRSIINIPFDSLSLPPLSVIRYANLTLYQEIDSLESFSIRMEPIKQDIDSTALFFDSDPYENLGSNYSSSDTFEGKIQISLKSYFQSLLMTDSLKNVGMKFSSSINNSLFDSVRFDLGNEKNRVDILYVSP